MVRRRLGVLVASLLIAPMIILMLVRNPGINTFASFVAMDKQKHSSTVPFKIPCNIELLAQLL